MKLNIEKNVLCGLIITIIVLNIVSTVPGVEQTNTQERPIKYNIEIQGKSISPWCEQSEWNVIGSVLYSVNNTSISNQWSVRSNFILNNITNQGLSNYSRVVNEDILVPNLSYILRSPIQSIFACQNLLSLFDHILNSFSIVNSVEWAKSFIKNLKTNPIIFNVTTSVINLKLVQMETSSVVSGWRDTDGLSKNDSFDKFQFGMFVESKNFDSDFVKNGIEYSPLLEITNSLKIVYKYGLLNNIIIKNDIKGKIDDHKFQVDNSIEVKITKGYSSFNLSTNLFINRIFFYVLYYIEWIIPVIIFIISLLIFKYRKITK